MIEENMTGNARKEPDERIDVGDYPQKWSLDKKGYFLIRINQEKQLIEVGHCNCDNQMLRVYIGKKPEDIMYKIIDDGNVSQLDHAAYLGKELQKAFLALKHNMTYVQDSELALK
jgi:tetrahydromethanopterin S-methyltransferase subunit A